MPMPVPTPFLEAGQEVAIQNHLVPAPYCSNPRARQPDYPTSIEEVRPRGLFHLNDTSFMSRNWVPQHNPDHGLANSVTCPRTNLVIRDPVSAPMVVGGHRDADSRDVLLRSFAYYQPAEASSVRDGAVEDNPLGLDLSLHL